MSLSTLERTRPCPVLSPRITTERVVVREPEFDNYRKQTVEVVRGWYDYELAHCDRHGTTGDGWGCSSTADFCQDCATELAEWERANPAPTPTCEWTRPDRETARDRRAEAEMFARLER